MKYITAKMIDPVANSIFIDSFNRMFGEKGMPVEKEQIRRLYKKSSGALIWLHHFLEEPYRSNYYSLFNGHINIPDNMTEDDIIDAFISFYNGNKKTLVDKIVNACKGIKE